MSKQPYLIDSDENSDYMYDLIKKIIDDAGPRAPCSENEEKAAQLLAEELKNYCDEVVIEDFMAYPQLGIVSWCRRCAVIALISFLVFLLHPLNPILFSIVAFGIGFFGLANIYFNYLKNQEWSPKIYPYKPKKSQNVVGIIKPAGEVKKRVIFSGHYDSAWRFNLIHHTNEGYAYFLVGGIGTFIFLPIMYLLQLFNFILGLFGVNQAIGIIIFNWVGMILQIGLTAGFLLLETIAVKLLSEKRRKKIVFGAFSRLTPHTTILLLGLLGYYIILDVFFFYPIMFNPSFFKSSIFVLLGVTPYLISMIFYLSRKAVPGAIDNLSAIAISVCIGKILSEWKTNYQDLFPKNTEVVIALFGCEEIGCRGAQAFAERHYADYNTIDTTNVNMDSLGDPEVLKIFDRMSSVRLDLTPEIYNLLAECAKELEINYEVLNQPWVSGGTDSIGMIRGGLKSGSLLGLRFDDYLHYYHTDRDDIAVINKERRPCSENGTDWSNRNIRCGLERALKVCLKYLEKKDRSIS